MARTARIEPQMLAVGVHAEHESKVYAHVTCDEKVFVDALGFVFNGGELAKTHLRGDDIFYKPTQEFDRSNHQAIAAAHLRAADTGLPVNKCPPKELEKWLDIIEQLKPR